MRGKLYSTGKPPLFEEYAQLYLKQQGHKAKGTIVLERGHIRFWARQFGQLRLNQITHARIREGLAVMNEKGKSQSTSNLVVGILRNVLNLAITDQLLRQLPITKDMTLKPRRKKRVLYTHEKLESLCDAAMRVSENGKQLCSFARLMAYSGGRMSEMLRLRWEDVDWECQTLCIGADGMAKGNKPRLVNFNPQLKAHLLTMLGYSPASNVATKAKMVPTIGIG